jgi:hypothetical protein
MTDELKRILSENNISGFQGDNVDELVRELKCDNLQLKCEVRCLVNERDRLKEELERYKRR